MKNLKILILTDYVSEYGGIEIQRIKIKNFLELKGHKVELFGSNKLNHKNFGIFNFKEFFKLRKKIKTFKPDFIEIHNIRFYLSPLILLAIPKKIKTFMYFRDYSYVCPKIWNINSQKKQCNKMSFKCISPRCYSNKMGYKYIFYNFFRLLKTIYINFLIKFKIDYIFTPSEIYTKIIKQKFPFKKVKTIRNSFTLDKSVTYKKGKYFLFVGRIEKEKGIIFLLTSFKKFLKNNPNELLLIIGTGSLQTFVKTFIRKNNLEKNIKYLGKIKHMELNKYYNNAKYTIVPSIWVECFGNVPIESLTNKTPVLTSDVAGFLEQSKIFENILTFNNFNQSDFLNKLEEIKRINKDKINFDNDLKIIEKDFSFENYHSQIIDFYNKVKNKK